MIGNSECTIQCDVGYTNSVPGQINEIISCSHSGVRTGSLICQKDCNPDDLPTVDNATLECDSVVHSGERCST
eukprot:UN01829